jgi:hypothetical protein
MRRYTRATGSGAIALTLSPEVAFQVSEVRVHLNAAGGAGNLTISLDSVAGAVYDVVLATVDMTAVVDLAWLPTRPHDFVAGDQLKVVWANVGGKTYGVEIVWSWIA